MTETLPPLKNGFDAEGILIKQKELSEFISGSKRILMPEM